MRAAVWQHRALVAKDGEASVQAGVLRWVVLFALCGIGVVARAENNNCGEPPEPSHYVVQSGDTEDVRHLAVVRAFNGQGKLELNVCSGELRIERGYGDRLK